MNLLPWKVIPQNEKKKKNKKCILISLFSQDEFKPFFFFKL